jgi:hypothetical protein
MCSANLCDIPGVCTPSPLVPPDKRGLVLDPSHEAHTLLERGQDHFDAPMPNGLNLFIIAAIVNYISQFYSGPNNGLIIRRQFRLRPGPCVGPAIDVITVVNGLNPPGLQGDETEHPLEVSTYDSHRDFTDIIFHSRNSQLDSSQPLPLDC